MVTRQPRTHSQRITESAGQLVAGAGCAAAAARRRAVAMVCSSSVPLRHSWEAAPASTRGSRTRARVVKTRMALPMVLRPTLPVLSSPLSPLWMLLQICAAQGGCEARQDARVCARGNSRGGPKAY